jgi:hypothetical protein
VVKLSKKTNAVSKKCFRHADPSMMNDIILFVSITDHAICPSYEFYFFPERYFDICICAGADEMHCCRELAGFPQGVFERMCQKPRKQVDPVKLREQLLDCRHSKLSKTLLEALRPAKG